MAAKIWISWKKSSLKIWASTRDTFVLGRDSNLGLSAINFFVLPSAADLFDFEQEVKLRFHFAAAADNGAKEFRQPSDTGRAISDLKKQKPEIVLRQLIELLSFWVTNNAAGRTLDREVANEEIDRSASIWQLWFQLRILSKSRQVKRTLEFKGSQTLPHSFIQQLLKLDSNPRPSLR